jgi:hypothetical protein
MLTFAAMYQDTITGFEEGDLVEWDGTYFVCRTKEIILEGFISRETGPCAFVCGHQVHPLGLVAHLSNAVGAQILNVEGLTEGGNQVLILTDKGTIRLEHKRSCCEQVQVQDICGVPSGVISSLQKKKSKQGAVFYEIVATEEDCSLRWATAAGTENRYGESVTVEFLDWV